MTPQIQNYDKIQETLSHVIKLNKNKLLSHLTKSEKNHLTNQTFSQVNLRHGVENITHLDTATSGAGSLLMEFGTLSRLTGDPSFENAARRAVDELLHRRNTYTGLLGK